MSFANLRLSTVNSRFLERIAHRNYYLAKLYYAYLFQFENLLDKDPLIIYQMGKVGSSSVVASLQTLGVKTPTFHVHTLVEAHRRQAETRLNLSPRLYFKRSKNALISRYLEKEINRSKGQEIGSFNKKWKVITLVRDPMAQNISSFFQVIDLYITDFFKRYESKTLQVKDLTELFLEQYSPDCIFNNWFDLEMKSVFGIDVYANKFPKSKGYEIYRGKWADLLLLRLENLSQCASEAFNEYLGIENFRLINKNIAHDKKYNLAYKEFKNTVELPDAHIDSIYKLKQVQHFYTDEEIQGFKARLKHGGEQLKYERPANPFK